MGASPRWIFLGQVEGISNTNENTSVRIIVANTSREVEIGLGRNFPKRALKGNQAIISTAALRNIGIDPKSSPTVELVINLYDLATTLLGEVTNDSPTRVVGPKLNIKGSEVNLDKMDIDLMPYLKGAMKSVEEIIAMNGNNPLVGVIATTVLPIIKNVFFRNDKLSLNELIEMCNEMGDKNPLIIRGRFEIVEAIESPQGKWPDALGKVILIDDSYLLPYLINSTATKVLAILAEQNPLLGFVARTTLPIASLTKNIKIEEFALTSQIVFKDRTKLYIESKPVRDDIARSQLAFLATEVFGLDYRAKYELTLLTSVDGISSFIILLNVIFMLVTFFLMLLSVLLIYSLMMSVRIKIIIECG